jgi:3-(3-hydroxy-phenyl)propionate hydroxylase
MIGESAPWKLLWISLYKTKALTLDSYRHGRVLFAGDAAHLVPIFGVRGLNSGCDDVGNLAWKLALVEKGASAELLDSYSTERVRAARENLIYGSKSTEFMAPPNYGFRLMRDAALRLATVDSRVKSLVNPRQTAPVCYIDSPLNVADGDGDFVRGPRPGDPAPEAIVQMVNRIGHLTEQFGRGFVLICFTDEDTMPLIDTDSLRVSARFVRVAQKGKALTDRLIDHHAEAWRRYDAQAGTVYLIRSDGYVLGRWRSLTAAALVEAMRPFAITQPAETAPCLAQLEESLPCPTKS